MAEGLALQVGEAEGVLLGVPLGVLVGEEEGVPEEVGVGLGLLPGSHPDGHPKPSTPDGHFPCPSASLGTIIPPPLSA